MEGVSQDQSPADALDDRERAMLELEAGYAARPPQPGRRGVVVRERFEMSETRYWQLVNGLLERPAALEAFPVVVGLLRRKRDAASRSRRSS